MSAVKAARAAKAAAERRRTWYVMTSRVGRAPRQTPQNPDKEPETQQKKTTNKTHSPPA